MQIWQATTYKYSEKILFFDNFNFFNHFSIFENCFQLYSFVCSKLSSAKVVICCHREIFGAVICSKRFLLPSWLMLKNTSDSHGIEILKKFFELGRAHYTSKDVSGTTDTDLSWKIEPYSIFFSGERTSGLKLSTNEVWFESSVKVLTSTRTHEVLVRKHIDRVHKKILSFWGSRAIFRLFPSISTFCERVAKSSKSLIKLRFWLEFEYFWSKFF